MSRDTNAPRRAWLPTHDAWIWIGPALSIAIGAADALVPGLRTPFATASELQFVAVLVAALLGGMVSGMATALIAAAMLVGVHASHMRADALSTRLLLMLACVPLLAFVGGQLRSSRLRRQQRMAAQRVLQHYRTLLEDLGTIVFEFDLTTQRVNTVSDSVQRILGYSAEQWLGASELRNFAQHAEDRRDVGSASPRLTATGGDAFEHRMVAADGRIVWLQTAIRTALDASDHEVIRGVSIDITAHKHAQAELQNALSLLTATLEATDNGILVADLEGRMRSYNRRFAEMWRIPEDLLHSGDDRQAIEYAATQVRDGEGFAARVRELYADPDATSFEIVEMTDGRVFERYTQPQTVGGRTVGRVWSFRDVTERVSAARALRESQERVRHMQKMEAVGQLAGGVAHDFNNILTAVLVNASLILEDTTVPMELRRLALDIQYASERAANLTRQLLAFGRRQMVAPHVEYLEVVLLENMKLLRISAGDRVTLETDLAPQPCPVLVERGQIEQVILNLVINARDAMPNGGSITLSTRRVDVEEANARDRAPFRPGRFVVLSVRDTGIGMDSATMARIFEPFFTTKDRGRGTGLGLATAYGIVHQSGGEIVVQSAPGKGANFDIFLPLCDKSPTATAWAPVDADTVLLVENEPHARSIMRESLARAGYRIVEAPHGMDALEIAGALPGRLDALVTDVTMSGIDGPEVANRMRANQPALPVMFITGNPDFLPAEVGTSVALHKPFAMETLARRIAELIERAQR